MNLRDVIRRLDAAEAMIRPANSLGARLKRLTTDQRATYDQWRDLRDKWSALFDGPGELYAAIINGNEGPQLQKAIRDALFGASPQILAVATDAQASEKWQRYLEQQ